MSNPTVPSYSVFLASSKELTKDRQHIGAFFGQLRQAYRNYGIQLRLFKYEYDDGWISENLRGKQAEYDEHVKSSDLCIILYRSTYGRWTDEEVRTAVKAHQETGHPEIAIWGTSPLDGERQSAELRSFLNQLEIGAFGVYAATQVRSYQDVREVEYDIMRRLSSSLAGPPLKIADGWAYVGDAAVLNVHELQDGPSEASRRAL